MIRPGDNQLGKVQQHRLDRYDAYVCADLHCHCLPALDDGPQNVRESIALCRVLAAQGITHVVATPHQLGRFDDCANLQQIRRSTSQLNSVLQDECVPLTVLPGAEIRVDERIVKLLAQGILATLADQGRFILLELPFEAFWDISPLLRQLRTIGLQAVIAHPERQKQLAANPERILDWSEYNPILQVTAASLVGRLGSQARQAAYAFLDTPLTAFVATDAHDTYSRRPCLADAFDVVAEGLGPETAQRLFIETPLSLINHAAVSVTPPYPQRRAQI